ncbi:uncharacterized protein Z520_05330 [Fonsecaea multimorphosa CBS 102226]|uniref:RNase III domain-containing protein n=1 Tax=Fonsecaea multimorphosa CBS 102226 TaxID=1442371 RepID=A0A0D2K6W9_9EURO|nr:uncharacterized protein Z520_05330 [Fonsecaea multimorphosa CBS 102226]KIX98869.1 hypothetical protein Z520_05330 [Fonsecaea multimorphosa CBS 102226]OAL25147.1 hypothetical protein AYO22_05024 [Fonsecaea multimorphosa]
MAQIQSDLTRAEEITRYQFRDRGLLYEALQSATRDRDELTGEIHESDGNRRLAKLGYAVLELAMVDEWFRRGMGHRELDLLRKKFLAKDYLSDAAQQKALHTCLSMSQRQENIAAPPTTMKLVLSAIVGAVWLDADENINGGLNNVKTKDEITNSREAGIQAVQELKDFIQELECTVRSFDDTCREVYENELEGLDSPSREAEDYLEPQMFLEEPCADHNNQVSLATSQGPSFEGESPLNLCFQSHGECDSDNSLPLTTISPHLISGLHPIRPRASAYQPISPSRHPEKRICLPDSLGGHAFRGPVTEMKSKVNSTRPSRRQTNHSPRGRTKTIAGSDLCCAELNSVVNSLICSVAGILSIIQLKQALRFLRERQVASNMGLPSSTKEIWKHLDILESNTHTNNVIHRLCLVRLHSRRNELKSLFGNGANRKRPGTSVIDKIAEDAEEEDRDKVKNRLHAGVIWDAIYREFSIGILALIPSGKADCASNAAVEKLSKKDLDDFLRPAKNSRHSFIKEAAQKVTQIMPLFEGTPCETVLKLERAGVGELESIRHQDEPKGLEFLDSV